MENYKLKNYRKRAYFFHLILSGAVCVVLAMHTHLLMIDASGEVIGAGMFLLVMWFGLPILVILGAVIFYTYKARTNWKILLLTILMLVLILQWLVEVEPAIIISIVIESVYVALTLVIGMRSLFEIKREQTS